MADIPDYNHALKILVVQIGKLGDMILTTPLFRNLKRLYPNSHLTVLASERNSELAENHPAVDKVLIYKKSSLKTFRLLFDLKNKKYDIWIDPKKEKSSTSTFLLNYAKPELSLGFNHGEPKPVFDIDLTNLNYGNHAVDINLSPINALKSDFIPDSRFPDIVIPEYIKNDVSGLFTISNGKFIFINLAAGMPARLWGEDNWLEFIKRVVKDYNLIINTYGVNPNEIFELKNQLSGNIFWLENLSYLKMAEFIRISDAVISPDTSAIHMASAFNIPVIDLMNNVEWNIERFAPLSKKQKILISDDPDSLKTITPDEVHRAFVELLNS